MHSSSSTPQLQGAVAGLYATSSCSTPHAPGTPSTWGTLLWRRARSFSSLAAAAAGTAVTGSMNDAAVQDDGGSSGGGSAMLQHLQEPMTPQQQQQQLPHEQMASWSPLEAPCWAPQQPQQQQHYQALQAPAAGVDAPRLQQWPVPPQYAQVQPCSWASPGLLQPLAGLAQQAGVPQAAAMVQVQLQPMLQPMQFMPVLLPGAGLSPMFAQQPPQPAAVPAVTPPAGQGSLWAMSWQAASALAEAALAQRQGASLAGCSNGAGGTAAPAYWHQQQQQSAAAVLLLVQPLCNLAHAAAAALLYVLAFVVSWALLAQQRAAAAGARCTAAAAACSGAIGSCRYAFMAAAAEAAGADSIEQLRAALQLPAVAGPAGAGSSAAPEEPTQPQPCAGSDEAQHTGASTPAAPGERALGLRLRGGWPASAAQREQQAATSDANSSADMLLSVQRLAAALGLWVGVLAWSGRWLPGRVHRQGMAAADAAGALLLQQLARALVALAWLAAKQVNALARGLYTHSAAATQRAASAAQQASCAMLYCIDLASADSSRQRSVLLSLLARLAAGVATRGAALCQLSMQVAEAAAVAIGAQLLRDANPVTRTAVSGLAGMLRRNVSESATLCWQLLLQLSAVYVSSLEGGGEAVAAA